MFSKKTVDFAADCFTGNYRQNNEDNMYCDGIIMNEIHGDLDTILQGNIPAHNNPSFAVFDGMGGEAYGETASYIAALEYKNICDLSLPPVNISKQLNNAVCAYAETHKISFMGSTSATLMITNKYVCGENIGDSSVFLFRNGNLTKLSTDHILPGFQGLKSPLYQYLGTPESECAIEPKQFKEKYQSGDFYLLCSDGLTDVLPSSEIIKILSASGMVCTAVMHLKKRVLEMGAVDNTTIILCKLK